MGTLRQIPITCSGHTRPVVDLKYSDITPTGYYIVSACKDGLPMLREGDTGDWIGTFDGHKGAVWGATINRDATRVATGAADFSVKLWDAQSGAEVHSFAHKHIVKSVDFSRPGTHLVTGCNDKMLRLFDLSDYAAEPKVFTGHTASIKKAIFSADSTKIMSISDDKSLRLWDVNNCSEIQSHKLPHAPSSLELSHDGQLLILTQGQTVELYNSLTLEKLHCFTMPCAVHCVTLHPTERVFVCAGENFILYKYSIDSGVELESVKGHFGPVHCVQFSPDGEVYASGSEDGTLRLWQNTIGKTYGLWKCVDVAENGEENFKPLENNGFSQNLAATS